VERNGRQGDALLATFVAAVEIMSHAMPRRKAAANKGSISKRLHFRTEPRLARTLLPLNTRLHLLCYRMISNFGVLAIRSINSSKEAIRQVDRKNSQFGHTFKDFVPSPATKIALH
jgi:hypothetical protein